MREILFEDGYVDEKGRAELPYKILKERVVNTTTELLVALNAAQNSIILAIDSTENLSIQNEKKRKTQGNIYLRCRIIDKNNKPYAYRLYFKSSNQLFRFFNQRFIVVKKSERKGVPEQLKLVFTEMGLFFPRRITCTINQGTMSVLRYAPPLFLNHMQKLRNSNKKAYYAILKLENASVSDGNYNLLITLNENSIRQIKKSLNADINEFNFVNFYFSKKKYPEFLRPRGLIYLTIPTITDSSAKNSNDFFKLYLNEKLYENFLVKEGAFDTVEEVRVLRASIEKMKGIHNYFLNIKFFLEFIRDLDLSNITVVQEYSEEEINYFLKIKNQLEDIDLKTLDYTSIKKREKFRVQCEVIFMDNYDILITRNNSLKIDYSLNFVENWVDLEYQKGYRQYLAKCKKKVQNSGLKILTEGERKVINSVFKRLKLNSPHPISSKLIRNAFYYASIFKTHVEVIENYYSEKKRAIIEQSNTNVVNKEIFCPKFDALTLINLPLILGAYYSFFGQSSELKTNNLILPSFSNIYNKFTLLERRDFELLSRFGCDLCYLYLVSEDLKYLKSLIVQKMIEKGYSEEQLILIDILSQFSGNYAKLTFKWAIAKHKLIAAATFAMFLIAFDLEKIISLSSICNNEKIQIDQSSLNREVLKLAKVAISIVHDFDFEHLAITSEESKLIIRQAIVNISIKALIRTIIAKKNSNIINELIDQMIFRIKFFNQYDFFKEILKDTLSELNLIRQEDFSILIKKKIEECCNTLV